jgi:hypothetical protein
MKAKYWVMLLMIIVAIAYFVGGLDLLKSKPSETDCLIVANNLIKRNNSANYIEVQSIQKNDAFDGSDPYNGQSYYAIKTKVTIRILNECEWGPGDKFNVRISQEGDILFKYYTPHSPGYIGEFNYNFTFYKTEKGWEGQDQNIY